MKYGSPELYRATIDTIEQQYMLNCQPQWLQHWIDKRAEMYKKLIEAQLREFDRG